MIRKLFSISLIFCSTILSVSLSAQAPRKKAQEPKKASQKVKEADLEPKYQEWLKLTAYIILPEEKDVFMKLANDFERDVFIEAFWKQRDPTPGTPENEYRIEMEKRFLYVNKEFHKDTPREGWMTDRGRMYMIMGEPKSISKFSTPEIQPCELWSYYGDTTKGQPVYFGLIFFRKGGSGEAKLYSPMTDGLAALVNITPSLVVGDMPNVSGAGNPNNPGDTSGYQRVNTGDMAQLDQLLMERAPDLEPYAWSIVPNDMGYELEPSVFSEMAMAAIFESPRKNVNGSYATHFMNYKGLVTTDYLTNFVDSEGIVVIAEDPIDGIPFLHYSITPKHLSVDYYQPADKYYCNFSVDASLKKGDTFIYQSSKDFSYYFPADQSNVVSANGVSIQDAFPVLPGAYQLSVLLRNSVGKEFSLLERAVVVPNPGGAPRIDGLMVGYKVEPADSATLAAFKMMDQKAYVDAKNSFSTTDNVVLIYNVANLTQELWQSGEIRVAIRGSRALTPAEKKFTVPLSRQPFHRIMAISQTVPAQDLQPDYYDLTLTLADGDKVIDTKRTMFTISGTGKVARPVILTKSLPRSSMHLQFLSLASEAEKIGDARSAESYYGRALNLAPDNPEATAYYCGFLMRAKQYERALGLIDKVKVDPALQFDYYIIKGKALRELGRYEEAIPLLEQGNRLYNSDTRLLNSLGFCYYKTGQTTLALEVLNASLRLNADQADIKKLVEDIGKK
jgi:GWxTD domain-containing protein